MGQPHGIGVIGLGVISDAYLRTLAGHPRVRIVALADLDLDRARAAAQRVPGARAATVPELLAMEEIGTVLDLTIPGAHAEVALACAAHGKHHYGEKPLASTLEDAVAVMESATSSGTTLGCAPDTVLGIGVQTARAAIEEGRIGTPTAAVATWVSGGHEAWHPHPDFYYTDGGGPLLDMGPYYVTSLVHLLGPVVAVTGSSARPRQERTIASGPRAGERIPVTVDTHVGATLAHVGGAVSTLTMSFDAPATRARPIEVHGQEGSLAVPDPNLFDGDVEITRGGDGPWQVLPPSAGFAGSSRGIGLLEMIGAAGVDLLAEPRASGAIGLHVMEVMTGVLTAARTGTRIAVRSRPSLGELVPFTTQARWRS